MIIALTILLMIAFVIICDRLMRLSCSKLYNELNVKSPLLNSWRVLYVYGVLLRNGFNKGNFELAVDKIKKN